MKCLTLIKECNHKSRFELYLGLEPLDRVRALQVFIHGQVLPEDVKSRKNSIDSFPSIQKNWVLSRFVANRHDRREWRNKLLQGALVFGLDVGSADGNGYGVRRSMDAIRVHVLLQLLHLGSVKRTVTLGTVSHQICDLEPPEAQKRKFGVPKAFGRIF